MASSPMLFCDTFSSVSAALTAPASLLQLTGPMPVPLNDSDVSPEALMASKKGCASAACLSGVHLPIVAHQISHSCPGLRRSAALAPDLATSRPLPVTFCEAVSGSWRRQSACDSEAESRRSAANHLGHHTFHRKVFPTFSDVGAALTGKLSHHANIMA